MAIWLRWCVDFVKSNLRPRRYGANSRVGFPVLFVVAYHIHEPLFGLSDSLIVWRDTVTGPGCFEGRFDGRDVIMERLLHFRGAFLRIDRFESSEKNFDSLDPGRGLLNLVNSVTEQSSHSAGAVLLHCAVVTSDHEQGENSAENKQKNPGGSFSEKGVHLQGAVCTRNSGIATGEARGGARLRVERPLRGRC